MACHFLKMTSLFYMMAYFVYIPESQRDGTYYTGSTQDLTERLQRHNQGRSQYTKSKRPWQLVYSEKHSVKSSAIKEKTKLKNGKAKTSLNL